jgi:hypothetical protein
MHHSLTHLTKEFAGRCPSSLGILPISNEEHSAAGVEVASLSSCNFVLPHRRCDRETNNTSNWNFLSDVRVQGQDDPIEFILSGTAVTLVPFTDKTEPSEGNADKIDLFSRNNDAVHRGGVRQNCFDRSKIDADRHGAGSLQRARFSEFDKALSIKLWKTMVPKSFVQEDEAGSLGATDILPDLFQVVAMKRDEIAEELDVAGFARRCRFLAIDPPLDINGPFLRVLSTEECLVDIFPLSSDLDSPRA